CLLIFPLALLPVFKSFNFTTFRLLNISFITGLIITSFYLSITYLLLLKEDSSYTLETFFRDTSYTYVELHPTYLALYFSFGFILSIDMFRNEDNRINRLFFAFCSICLLPFIFLSAARLPIIAF